MAWEQLSVNRPHLVYIILGGFTTLFMLCSSVIKERLYIGEATVATICGIIFGPHGANLIDPGSWGNVDQITLEFSRIVLVVQCFAVGVELPKYYMERHWKSVVFLLVPVMTFGWLVTSLFIWAMFSSHLNWLDSLVCAACVTATDPVLASSVVGKGKFAKRVPKHLRDLLSAESGCNDGMAFPFIYLGIYLIRYRPDANTVALHWFCNTILYECIWGATYGVIIGYLARRAIRYAHEHDLIDRESFLVFYFVLALFCAGSGSLLGMDDLLIGFACGVGFSNDGWFLEKTEEAHVSNVIDLLINLAFFVYFGTIIPWATYNSDIIGVTPWRLVVVALLVVFFRRIPIMLALKTFIPDVKTWREALFAGHFGPIGVGALFVAILARAELENETTTPLAKLPDPGFEHLNIIELIWPITTFLVITSIIVHGSSIAVFTLGKHINTLTITMSYTQANEQANWMDRLPRIQSRSRTQMSKPLDSSESDLDEKLPDYPPAVLPRNFLRRQRDEDTPSRSQSATPSLRSNLRRKKWDSGMGPGGHIEQSAIAPQPRPPQSPSSQSPETSDTTAVPSPDNEEDEGKHLPTRGNGEPIGEVYEEGRDTVFEDEEGNVLEVMKSPGHESREDKDNEIQKEITKLMSNEDEAPDLEPDDPMSRVRVGDESDEPEAEDSATGKKPGKRSVMQRLGNWRSAYQDAQARRAKSPEEPKRTHGPARAFKIGNTIIVEDEDGEVIKKYDIPPPLDRRQSYVDEKTRQRLQKMGKWMGMGQAESEEAAADASSSRPRKPSVVDEELDDNRIRFTMEGNTRRLSKADFIKQIQSLDPKARAEVVEESDAPEAVKQIAREDAKDSEQRRPRRGSRSQSQRQLGDEAKSAPVGQEGEVVDSRGVKPAAASAGAERMTPLDEQDEDIPMHDFSKELRKYSAVQETAAERRRRAASKQAVGDDSEDDGTARVPFRQRRSSATARDSASRSPRRRTTGKARAGDEEEETAAEKRRREAALGMTREEDSDDEEDGNAGPGASGAGVSGRARGIRFVDQTQTQRPAAFGNIRWGSERGR